MAPRELIKVFKQMLPFVFLICAVIIPWALPDSHKNTYVVETTSGPIRGEQVISDGVKFKAFRGVPYAQPPVGALRFKAPEPPKKWVLVRDATRYGSICYQPSFRMMSHSLSFHTILRYLVNLPNVLKILMRALLQSEDCLTLNVFTTKLGGADLKPVLVYIHGGGFFLGDGTDTMYGPDFLIKKDIVVVTMNYRLGVLGFLATNTSDAPGNWGLKDQNAALRWVQGNIARFGGDPKQVTIHGASSGAAGVQYHMMSPFSKGLFHRAILASGSPLCSWAFNKDPDRLSRQLAEMNGASPQQIDDPAKRVQFLRNIDAGKLTDGLITMISEDQKKADFGILTEIPFAAVVEPGNTPGAFITEDPKSQLAAGRFARVPTMTGINSLEGGILYMGFSKLNSADDLKKKDLDVCKLLPRRLREAIREKEDCDKVNREILSVYFGGNSTRSSPLKFTQLFGDMVLAHPTMRLHAFHARFSTNDSPAFFYYLTYDGEWNLFKDTFQIHLPGVVHGGDINYVFSQILMKLPKLTPTSPGYHTLERMLGFISDFVKHGNPTPTTSGMVPILWEPSTKDKFQSMVIDADLKMEEGVLKDRMALWDKLYKQYLPHDPY